MNETNLRIAAFVAVRRGNPPRKALPVLWSNTDLLNSGVGHFRAVSRMMRLIIIAPFSDRIFRECADSLA